MLFRAILCGSVWNGFLLGQAKKEEVFDFVAKGLVMVIYFGTVPFSFSAR